MHARKDEQYATLASRARQITRTGFMVDAQFQFHGKASWYPRDNQVDTMAHESESISNN